MRECSLRLGFKRGGCAGSTAPRSGGACAVELAEVALRGRTGRTMQRAERRGEAVVRADYATVRARRWRAAAVDRRSALVSSGEWRKKVTDLYPWPRVPSQKFNRYLCRP